MSAPLEGITLLDLTRLLPGPFATLLLCRLGANVIKMEDTQQGDYLRTISPEAFEALNAGKRSISLDLKNTEGRTLFFRLVEHADVLVESFRPGVVQRLGIDYEKVHERQPKLIYASLTGYGQTGPLRDHPGHDLNYLGIGGGLTLSSSVPQPNPLPVADESSGLFLALAITSALYQRKQSGEGSYIDLSMTDAAAFFTLPMHVQQMVHPYEKGALDALGGYGVYSCADGTWISLGVIEDKFWRNLCGALGRSDWLQFYATLPSRSREKEQIDAELNDLFKQRPRIEWLTLFAEHDVPAAPVNAPHEVLQDPQIQARQLIDFQQGRLVFQYPVRSSSWSTHPPSPAPKLGEQTEEILKGVGMTEAVLQQAVDAGILRIPKDR